MRSIGGHLVGIVISDLPLTTYVGMVDIEPCKQNKNKVEDKVFDEPVFNQSDEEGSVDYMAGQECKEAR